MTHRDRVMAVLSGETPDVIPSLGECPMDATSLKGLAPEPTGDPVADAIREAEFYDNSSLEVGVSPRVETISRDDSHHLYRYATGAVWRASYSPVFCREMVDYPIKAPADLDGFVMPRAKDDVDCTEMARRVQAWKDAGYFVQGTVMGAWQAIYYLLTSFENILMWMAAEPAAARRLFELTSDYCLEASRLMLEAGVDAVFTSSDLGSGQGLLFSQSMFAEYVLPWLKELADLGHERGAILHLHSHGHIQDLMDDMVDAGVDLINPVGPSDHNDLAYFKANWGGKISIMGGISTTIAQMTVDEIDAHVAQVMEIGCRGSRFFPRTESGIPAMPVEKVLAYLDLLKQYRRMYGSAEA